MFIFHLPEKHDMFCRILGSILVLGAGVLGQVNTNGNGSLNCDSIVEVFGTLRTCAIERSSNTSFIDDDYIRGNKIISAVTTTCRNYPLVQACLSNITANCVQLDPKLKTVADRDHARLCNGNQPSAWYLKVMTDGFELKKNCAVSLITETLARCPIEEPTYGVFTDMHVSAWLSWTESYVSSELSCLMANLKNTIADNQTCDDVQATDIMLVFYSYMTVVHQLRTGFSPTDDVFQLFKSFVAPPSKRDSWTYDWPFNNGRQ